MKYFNKIGYIVIVSCLLNLFSFKNATAQFGSSNNNNTLQTDIGESGTIYNDNSGTIDEPSTFDPGGSVGTDPGSFEPESDPGGPGGDIDDLGAIPLDGGVTLLLAIGLVVGYIHTRKQNNLTLEKFL